MACASKPLQKAIEYAQMIEREFFLVDVIQETEFETVISIDRSADNDLMEQYRLITFYQKVMTSKIGCLCYH